MQKLLALVLILILASSAFAQESTSPEAQESTTTEAQQSLSSVGQDASAVLLELEDDGLIPSGASPAFSQTELNYSGEGVQFSNFGIGLSAKNLLYSATLSFSPNSENLEFCGIAARTLREETNRQEENRSITTVSLNAYLLIGLDNRGNLFVADNQSDESSATTVALPTEMTSPIQITALIINNTLYVYANETLLIDALEIADGSGAFAFVFNSAAEETACTGEMLFAYTFPDEIVTTCTISPIDVANKRSTASTDASVMGQLLAGESAEASAQMQGTDGYTWWQLSDETWVRDDVVTTAGFCRALPIVVN